MTVAIRPGMEDRNDAAGVPRGRVVVPFSVTLRDEAALRARLWRSAALSIGLGLGATSSSRAAPVFLTAAFVLLGASVLDRRRRVVVSVRGLCIVGLRRRHVPWSDIEAVAVDDRPYRPSRVSLVVDGASLRPSALRSGLRGGRLDAHAAATAITEMAPHGHPCASKRPSGVVLTGLSREVAGHGAHAALLAQR